MKTKKELYIEYITAPKKLFCGCGCRGVIIVLPGHRYNGIPEYINGHNMKTKEARDAERKRVVNDWQAHPEKKDAQRKRATNQFKNSIKRKNHREGMNTTEAKKKQKEGLEKSWKDKIKRERYITGINKSWQDPIKRKNRVDSMNTAEAKKKMRVSAIKHIKEKCGGVRPNLGANETQILKELKLSNNIIISPQYYIRELGYWVDCYIFKLNTVIEIEEKYHNSIEQKKRDNYRRKEIINKLNCNFIRIKDNF